MLVTSLTLVASCLLPALFLNCCRIISKDLTSCPPGEVLLDDHYLALPSDLSLDYHQLGVGIRDPDMGKVLAVEVEDGVVIETLEIVRRE